MHISHFTEARASTGTSRPRAGGSQRQPQNPPRSVHCPQGHVPPQAGACAMTQVSSQLAHWQLFPPLARPQVSPLGHVPPHAGTEEPAHEVGKGAQVHEFGLAPVGAQTRSGVEHEPPQAGACEM